MYNLYVVVVCVCERERVILPVFICLVLCFCVSSCTAEKGLCDLVNVRVCVCALQVKCVDIMTVSGMMLF